VDDSGKPIRLDKRSGISCWRSEPGRVAVTDLADQRSGDLRAECSEKQHVGVYRPSGGGHVRYALQRPRHSSNGARSGVGRTHRPFRVHGYDLGLGWDQPTAVAIGPDSNRYVGFFFTDSNGVVLLSADILMFTIDTIGIAGDRELECSIRMGGEESRALIR
jgi:hypothetical protein